MSNFKTNKPLINKQNNVLNFHLPFKKGRQANQALKEFTMTASENFLATRQQQHSSSSVLITTIDNTWTHWIDNRALFINSSVCFAHFRTHGNTTPSFLFEQSYYFVLMVDFVWNSKKKPGFLFDEGSFQETLTAFPTLQCV